MVRMVTVPLGHTSPFQENPSLRTPYTPPNKTHNIEVLNNNNVVIILLTETVETTQAAASPQQTPANAFAIELPPIRRLGEERFISCTIIFY
jgi:succinylglutamate desuccinylase